MAESNGTGERGRICVGVIAGARGLRGQVWVRSFTAEPAAVAGYGPVGDEAGTRQFRITVVDVAGERVLVRIDGVADRSAAEALKGVRLYVPRARLPAPDDDEFYHADLIGLAVAIITANEPAPQPAGYVRAVHDYGAGAVLEVGGGGFGTLLVPFTRAAVPEVDLAQGRIVINGLPGLIDEARRVAGPDPAVADGEGPR